MPAGSDWREEITRGVDEALAHGFFLVLLSPDAVGNDICDIGAISYALERQAAGASNVVPVVVREIAFDALYRDPSLSEITPLNFVLLTEEDRRPGITWLIQTLKAHPV